MKTQKGAAILMAMLTVALVAALSAAALWQQWRGVELETAERARVQSGWILLGALDWARLILREDAKAGSTDHLAEPWAVPLQEARLSTFLAARTGQSDGNDEMEQAFLSGQITDMQSKLNVMNLVQDGKVDPAAALAFAKLFEALHLPEGELESLASMLKSTLQGATTPAPGSGQSADTMLLPVNIDQLVWLGLSQVSIETLRPYLTVLPDRTPVNLNTAPALVLYACIPGASLAEAQRLVDTRSMAHFTSLADAKKQLNASKEDPLAEGRHSVSSRFFEVRGQLRLGERIVQERSLVQREGQRVKVLWRERGALPPLASLQ
jgi:general secretion pathway protein K